MSSQPPKLYLCGPMTGIEHLNYPAFSEAALALRCWGYQVFNPAENGLPSDAPWATHMRVDIVQLMQCEAVALLPGWGCSKGATLEMHIATALGMPAQSYEDWIQEARSI